MLKIGTLHGFSAVARSGNLRDAADTLGRTRSAVPRMPKRMDAHLGEALFGTTRKNRLTALGAFVLEQAPRELQQFDNTVRAIEDFAKAVYGSVRIATVPSVAGTIMPQVFQRHIGAFSQVQIELRDMDSGSIIHALSRGRIDIGIATAGGHAPGLEGRLLMAEAFGAICAPGHPLAAAVGPVAWEELVGERLIADSLAESFPGGLARRLQERSLLKARNVIPILRMVRARIGITLLPQRTVLAFPPGELVFRPLADGLARRELHLLRRAGISLSPAAQLLERHILDTVADMREACWARRSVTAAGRARCRRKAALADRRCSARHKGRAAARVPKGAQPAFRGGRSPCRRSAGPAEMPGLPGPARSADSRHGDALRQTRQRWRHQATVLPSRSR